ncbi:MAG TPA: NAD(P)/FAD-dependent oxidoreductase [Pirellulaceae bacterium]|jgi:protoporphyrinogen oxidase
MSQQREHFGIVGGGLLGLTLALRLAQQGKRVTVLEAADHVGGLADAWQIGDVTWDRHYHVTLLSDQHLRGVLKELGLDEQMQWVKTKTGFLVDGRLHSLSSVWDFLGFPPLNLIDKLRLGWTIWHASRIDDWKTLERQSVGDWLVKHSGRRTFERIWLPLLKAKLGDAWQRTSAAFIWASIQRMYAARRGGQKQELFGYLPGGYSRVLAAFREKLGSLGVEIQTGCRVKSIVSDSAGGVEIATADGKVQLFDRAVVTTPAPVAAQMCSQLTSAEADRLKAVEYVGILCASLVLKKPLAGYYVTNITDAAPFTGVIEMTALVDPAEFGGKSLVYLPKYVGAGDEAWKMSDEQIETQFVAALERLSPTFSRADVLAFRVSRVRNVFALSTLGYSRNVPPIDTSVPGLFLVNSAQIVNGTLNVNETVRLAESALETICRPLEPRTNRDAAECQRRHSLPVFPYQPQDHVADDCELIARSR